MEYRRMGRSGLKVSEICLGTMTFGRGADEAESGRMVAASMAAGVNFFDTADGYNNGLAEEMLGRILKPRRREAVIATKFLNQKGGRPNVSGKSRLKSKQPVEDILPRRDVCDFDQPAFEAPLTRESGDDVVERRQPVDAEGGNEMIGGCAHACS